MGLYTYTTLQAAIATLLVRTDLSASIPGYIALAEAQMNRELRTRHQVCRKQVMISGETMPLPCEFRSVLSFRTRWGKLQYLSPEGIAEKHAHGYEATEYGGNGTGVRYYSIVGNEFLFHPRPAQPVPATLTVRQTIPSLSTYNPTNWLLDRHPDAYLYGAALQSAPQLQDDERIEVWGDIFSTILKAISAEEMGMIEDSLQTQSGISDGTWGNGWRRSAGSPY